MEPASSEAWKILKSLQGSNQNFPSDNNLCKEKKGELVKKVSFKTLTKVKLTVTQNFFLQAYYT